MLFALIALVVLAVAVAALVVTALNKLRGLSISVEEAAAGIDVQLTRRAELIPNLVSAVKGYIGHERDTLTAVTAARTAARAASTVGEKAAADAQMTASLMNLFAVAEAYPELKADQGFAQLQGELSRTEDTLAFSRQYYNDSAATLNRTMATIPWSIFTGMAGVSRAKFYAAPEANVAAPTVNFDI